MLDYVLDLAKGQLLQLGGSTHFDELSTAITSTWNSIEHLFVFILERRHQFLSDLVNGLVGVGLQGVCVLD